MGTKNDSLNPRVKSSYSQYISVRQKLDDLGYNKFLSNDSVDLVDRLLNDLLLTKKRCGEIAQSKEQAERWKKENESPNDCSTQFSNRQQLEHMLLREKKTNVENVKGLMVDNNKLAEQIEDMKFVLARNAEQIKKLNSDNFSKSQIILQLQSEIPENQSQNKPPRLRSHIEKPFDLPPSNLSKIQSLYKQILSASEDPAIVDWVKASEGKIKSMEQDVENTKKALEVSEKMCEEYHKKVKDN